MRYSNFNNGGNNWINASNDFSSSGIINIQTDNTVEVGDYTISLTATNECGKFVNTDFVITITQDDALPIFTSDKEISITKCITDFNFAALDSSVGNIVYSNFDNGGESDIFIPADDFSTSGKLKINLFNGDNLNIIKDAQYIISVTATNACGKSTDETVNVNIIGSFECNTASDDTASDSNFCDVLTPGFVTLTAVCGISLL